ncbi:MAG: glycosyltransferase family 2 protein [SAR324 cluster bacterium]|nr:glycosyltransferase family 2 protein [SAR324 cluster bacterium]MBL7035076.1 glycosyltransferase family 2 protein [SAR324 cluster bacterium]
MSKLEKKVKTDQTPEIKQNSDIFSIVIPTYNSALLLSRCLEALEKQSAPKSEFEVTVADDGSTDETVEMLRQFQARTELKFQWTTIQNAGPGNARNAGVAVSSGSWIGFMDADVIPRHDWVASALKQLKLNPDAGAFEGSTEVTQRNRATPFTHQTENTDGGRYPTCNFLVRRSLAHFHPAYRIPFREDTDLAFSILAAGYAIIFVPELVVEHPPLPSSYARPLNLARRYYYDGLLARRFPERYQKELDAHLLLGCKIPHLKRKLYAIFALSQIVFLAALLLGFAGTAFFISGSAYLGGLVLTAAASLRYAKLRDLSFKDWLVFVFQLHILPWVMGYSLLRGWRDFRGESKNIPD